jgi:large conductance mechanosensitive channel
VQKDVAMAGFKKFILRGNLVELAVAVLIATAFGTLIVALTKDFITPLLAAIGGKPDFSALSFTINKSKFLYGDFINNVISFLIIAAILYFFVVVPFSKLLDRYKPAPDDPAPVRDCPSCLSSVPQAASVCAYCTRDLPAFSI